MYSPFSCLAFNSYFLRVANFFHLFYWSYNSTHLPHSLGCLLSYSSFLMELFLVTNFSFFLRMLFCSFFFPHFNFFFSWFFHSFKIYYFSFFIFFLFSLFPIITRLYYLCQICVPWLTQSMNSHKH